MSYFCDLVQSDWEDRAKPFLIGEIGAKEVGVVGNCVGSYFAMHASADPLVKCAFSTHPAHKEVVAFYPVCKTKLTVSHKSFRCK